MQKIFVIETYDDLRDVYAEVLSLKGYEVRAFSDWQAAYAAIERGHIPHTLIFDPYQGGAAEILRFGTGSLERKGINIFAVSSLREQQLPERYAYDAVLHKPIDLDELLELVE